MAGLYAAGAQAAVSPLELVGPISDYKIYVAENVRKLAADTRAFTAAVKAGDIEKAKKLYAPTRTSYERIEPVAELFNDLDKSIDSRADDHEKAEKDPAFGGFHRIEYGLWVQKSTKELNPVADKLLADVLELQKRLGALTFPPEKVVGGAAVLMEEVAATKISGEENRYSHTDLWDFQSNFEGAFKIVELLRPLVAKENKAFSDKADANFKVVFDTLAKYRTPDGGFETYSKLSERDRKLLAGRVNTLAEDLSKLRGMLGLN
ncbi:iron transporter [Variovorax paradoxus]|nr:iron transporter [Variovorax paradoxus]KPU98039.1 iron transporter [Variovorax paradoxus]KPV05448.1 iron transporter [Variovorax paradoxus]KPV15614.1 iron transporter [Variovorax paradoxus]KPV26206.1 iron transporter [Variovorax paradoxus]